MLRVTDAIEIDVNELEWAFSCAGGPGGQNVNKVATKVQLRWNLARTEALPDDVMQRLRRQQRTRITKDDELLLSSQRYRDQERNRQDCLDKLCAIVQKAAVAPRPRKASRPTRASRERRLANKRHRSAQKSSRRPPDRE